MMTEQRIKDAYESIPLPAGVEIRLQEKLEAELQSPLRQRRVIVESRRRRWLPVLTAAAAVLVLLLAGVILRELRQQSRDLGALVPASQPGEADFQLLPEHSAQESMARAYFSIPEDANVGPRPDESCYGAVSPEEPEKLMDVIRSARERGLLGKDEPVAFDPAASFYTGQYSRDIAYYLDDSILVMIWKEELDGMCCTFLEVKVSDPSQFRRKLADDSFGAENQYTASQMALQTNAVAAVNADAYSVQQYGVIVWNRELYRYDGEEYSADMNCFFYNCLDTLYIDSKGDFQYTRVGEEYSEETLRQWMQDKDILFSVAYGPVLVEGGEPVECSGYPVGAVDRAYSRAGIGQMGPCHYLYMSLNHGDREARWTVTDFAGHFAEKPVITAYCLVGGQFAEAVFRGEPYNYIDYGAERPVSDILYFVTAVPEDSR